MTIHDLMVLVLLDVGNCVRDYLRKGMYDRMIEQAPGIVGDSRVFHGIRGRINNQAVNRVKSMLRGD